jgi:hypothetical protein
MRYEKARNVPERHVRIGDPPNLAWLHEMPQS